MSFHNLKLLYKRTVKVALSINLSAIFPLLQPGNSSFLESTVAHHVLCCAALTLGPSILYLNGKRGKIWVHFLLLITCSVIVQLFVTPWTEAQPVFLSFTISWGLLKLMSIESMMPSISSSVISFSSSLKTFPASGSFLMSRLFVSGGQILELQLQHQSFQWIFRTYFVENWLAWSLCWSRDSQESSPTPQFKSINSSVLSFLYGPMLTSIHDYWKNHSFD